MNKKNSCLSIIGIVVLAVFLLVIGSTMDETSYKQKSTSNSTNISENSSTETKSDSSEKASEEKASEETTPEETTPEEKDSSDEKSYETSKKTSPYESYDEGYEAIYEDDDYDYERYQNDPDYADVADDAIISVTKEDTGDFLCKRREALFLSGTVFRSLVRHFLWHFSM